MKKALLTGSILLLMIVDLLGQKDKLPRFFDDPIIIDSSSTIIIPTRYNVDMLATNKLALWENFYANIIFYNFQTDSVKRLFPEDSFIRGFSTGYNSYYANERNEKLKNVSDNYIFYFVKEMDYNKSGRIDNEDPSVLYYSDKHGNFVKALTPSNENAISIQIFDTQNIALIKMQRDFTKDKDFNFKDKDYYYISLNLINMSLGTRIEIK